MKSLFTLFGVFIVVGSTMAQIKFERHFIDNQGKKTGVDQKCRLA